MSINLELLQELAARGFCSGSGSPADGRPVCLEQAIALACGLPLTDTPDTCVTPAVSAFGRRLNDAHWSSDRARADGLFAFAVAQAGTADWLDGTEFAKRLAIETVRQVLPVALRAAGLEEHATACEAVTTPENAAAAARSAAESARAAARSAAESARAAARSAAESAAESARATAWAARPGDHVLTLAATIATTIISEMDAERESKS